MNAIDVLCWIVIGGAILLVLVMFIWSLCSIARLSDMTADEYWEKYLENKENE